VIKRGGGIKNDVIRPYPFIPVAINSFQLFALSKPLPSRVSLSIIHPMMSVDADTLQEIIEETEQAEEFEPPFKIFIHNDDVTPFDFVILILQKIFQLSPLEAEHVAYVAHSSGVAYVATLPKNEAQQRVGKAHFAASLEGYPLLFTIEPES
jgi:ATP-dependent Clp protease adaptor protein ClpS